MMSHFFSHQKNSNSELTKWKVLTSDQCLHLVVLGWCFDPTWLHWDIFVQDLKFIICGCDTWSAEMIHSRKKIAFCFDRRDAIGMGRQGKQNDSTFLRNGWQQRTSQVDSECSYPSWLFVSVLIHCFWLPAQVFTTSACQETSSSRCSELLFKLSSILVYTIHHFNGAERQYYLELGKGKLFFFF